LLTGDEWGCAEALTFNLVYASAYHQWEEDTLFTNKILKTI